MSDARQQPSTPPPNSERHAFSRGWSLDPPVPPVNHDTTIPDRPHDHRHYAHAGAPPPLGSLEDGDSDEDRHEDDRPAEAAPPAAPVPQSQLNMMRNAGSGSTGTGDIVLFLGLPHVFTVGYDALSLTARYFVGLRDVPPGPHFFWAAHPSGPATRSGFFIVSNGGKEAAAAEGDEAAVLLHAVKWDADTEMLRDVPPGEMPSDLHSLRGKLRSYRDPTAMTEAGSVGDDVGHGVLAADSAQLWRQMTGFVTEHLLSRVTGQSRGGRGIGAAAVWHVSTTDHIRGQVVASAERRMEERISTMRHDAAPLHHPARELRFALDQHAKTYSAQRFGAERTLEATDSTSYILSLLDESGDGSSSSGSSDSSGAAMTEADIVGELQFAFIAGVHLGNDACLEQWWYVLLRLLFRAYALPRARPRLVADCLRAVTAQLAYGSEYLDTPITEMSEARGRELRLALIVYKRRLEELLGDEEEEEEHGDGPAAAAAVGMAFSRLEAVVARGFGWDLRGEYLRKGRVVMEDGEEVELEMKELQAEDERGEWAPEVIELDEHGRQKDLISWND